MHSLSAPLVSGRDFVAERWRVEMTAPITALALEKTRVAAARGRVEVGIATPSEVDVAATRIAELEAAIEAFERKLTIRQTYLKGNLPAKVAELQGLEAENEVRRAALTRRIESAPTSGAGSPGQDRGRHRQSDRARRSQAAPPGAAAREMTKADYDLLLIRKQLGK